jgi:hypothetical protein
MSAKSRRLVGKPDRWMGRLGCARMVVVVCCLGAGPGGQPVMVAVPVLAAYL